MIHNVEQKKWYEPSLPDEIKPIPWLAPIVIQYLEEIIQPDFEVLEHGSGGSTLWLHDRARFVIAKESNLEWYKAIGKYTSKRKDCFVILDGNPPKSSTFYSCYNLILIDGEPIRDRAEWIIQSIGLVKPNGWIVLDNANRPEYKKEREYLQKICKSFETFDCNEIGLRYLVTEFYRMK